MFQVCVVAPHLSSSPAEPSSSPESWAAGGEPLFPPSFGLEVDTWINLAPSALLPSSFVPSVSQFLATAGGQDIWSRFWWGREQFHHSNPTGGAGVVTGLCFSPANTEVHCDQQCLVTHRLLALLSSLLPSPVPPKGIPSITGG